MSDYGRKHNPHRLYRNREKAMLAGVCAGLADYFGFNLKAVRIIFALATIPFPPAMIVGYLALAILLPVRPTEQKRDEEVENFWRGVSNAPSDVFSNTRHRFRELDRRLQRMEAFVTSREFEIDRELGRGPGAGRGANGNAVE